MDEKVFNKLVRDNIPEIIEANGERAITRQLNPEEYKRALLEKLVEEANELLESGGDLDERADIAEVIMAIDKVYGFTPEQVEAARSQKAAKRGRFEERIYLEKVTRQ